MPLGQALTILGRTIEYVHVQEADFILVHSVCAHMNIHMCVCLYVSVGVPLCAYECVIMCVHVCEYTNSLC